MNSSRSRSCAGLVRGEILALLLCFSLGLAVLSLRAAQPPVIVVTTPANNAQFTALGCIDVSAMASDADTFVGRVDFFATGPIVGTNVLFGTLTNTLPGTNIFSLTWSNVPSGSYALAAVAVDSGGDGATSAPVNLEVVSHFFLAQNGSGTASALPARTSYQVGQAVTLTATPRHTNWTRFLRWSDGNTNSPRAITVGTSNVFTAIFTNFVPLEEQVLQQWETVLPGLGTGGAYSIVEVVGGGYFVGGSSDVFGGGITATNHGGNDYWVVRLDAGGQKLWDRSFGGTGDDYLSGLVATDEGGCLLGGYSKSPISGNKTSPVSGLYDFWVIRLDQNGDELWQHSYGGPNPDAFNSGALTSDGGFILGGSVFVGQTDLKFVRVDRDGNMVWERTFGGTGDDGIQIVRQTADGGFVAGGLSTSPPGGSKTSPLYGQEDAWVIRLDANGNKLWDKSYGSTASDSLTSLGELPDGGLVLYGRTSSTNGPPSNRVAPMFGVADAWAIRTDANGTMLFDATYGGNDQEIDDSVAPLPDGGFIISGASLTTSIGGNKTGTNYGSNDGFLARFSAEGTKLWDHSFGGTGSEIPKEMVRTGDGGFVLAGYTEAGGGGTKTTTNAGVWVVKFLTREVVAGTPALTVNGQSSFSNQFVVDQTNSARIDLRSSFPSGFIFYTLDGSEPDSGSELYAGPFTISNSVVVRAVAVDQFFNLPGVTNEAVTVTIVASFDLLTSTPGGGTVTRLPSASRYPSNSVVTLTASPLPGWTFLNWAGDASGTSAVTSVIMDGPRSVQAVFGTTLTVTNSGPGIVLRSPALDAHPYGTVVRLSAVPDASKFFSSWSGAHSGGISPLEFTVTNANPNVTAAFANLPANRFALTALIKGEGSVVKNPQATFYTSGASVVLTATPKIGHYFTGWSNAAAGATNPFTVLLDTNRIITANFAPTPANFAPIVSLGAPTNDATFVAPASITLQASASDLDGTITAVYFFEGASLLGSKAGAPFTLSWSNVPAGTYSLRAVATDNGGLSATSTPVNVTVIALNTNVPVFSWSNQMVSVDEGAGTVTLHVFKNANSVAANLGYSTRDGSATDSGATPDYNAASGLLSFAAGETVKPVTITILQDLLVESNLLGNQYFFVTLSPPSAGGIAGENEAQVTILDDDITGTNSFLQYLAPAPPPPSLGNLRVSLSPTNIFAQWRLGWETDWRDSGTILRGMVPGNYEVAFKPVAGFLEPFAAVLPVAGGLTNDFSFSYSNSAASQIGSLVVTIEPPLIATAANVNARGQWRRQGEPAWHDSGEHLDGLPAGNYLIEFKTLNDPAWLAPGAVNAAVTANAEAGVTGNYYVANTSPGEGPRLLDFESEIKLGLAPPYAFCGQLLTPLGWGSGTVVKENVVLTAAHVVFDDHALAYVPNSAVKWFFQRQAGVYEPAPQTPRGWMVLGGYAAQRTLDATPGVASPAAQELDVAALYFSASAGRGGYSGYLVSTGDELINAALFGTIVGYPVEGVSASERGQMHATPLKRLLWAASSAPHVFATTNVKAYPGNSGGPVCLPSTNAAWYPAAIFLGGAGNTVARVIDSAAGSLIAMAEQVAPGIGQSTGGEPVRRETDCPSCSLGIYGVLEVSLQPTNIGALGGGYRFKNATNGVIYREPFNRFFVLGTVPWTIEFLPAPYAIAPTNRTITTPAGQTNKTTGLYKQWGQLVFDGVNFRALGSSGAVYRIDFKTGLDAAAWTPVRTQTLSGSGLVLTNLVPGASNGFFRAVLVP